MIGRALAVLAGCAGVIALLQAPAVRLEEAVHEKDDVYLLPADDQLRATSLGYRAAVADMMWANVLVNQGFRLQQKRHYDNLVPLLAGISVLDPEFRSPYLMADSLITFQPTPATVEEARETRRYLELGVKNRPYDAQLWEVLGTFVCFLAPSSILVDEEEKAAWRRAGALYLERSLELAGSNKDLAWSALGGANRLEALDDRIHFYQRVLDTSDDPELRERAQKQLETTMALQESRSAGNPQAARASAERQEGVRLGALEPVLKTTRRRYYPGLPWPVMMTAGPPQDSAVCAGGVSSTDHPDCARTWKAWAASELHLLGLDIGRSVF